MNLNNEQGICTCSCPACTYCYQRLEYPEPFAVEVQPPEHVREYVAMVMEGEYSIDELRFVVYNDVPAYEWLLPEDTDELLRWYGYDPVQVGLEGKAFAMGCLERYRHLWEAP